MYNSFSYIIPYRKSSPDREAALNFTIKYLNQHFPELEVIIVEQDKKPKENNLTGHFRKIFTYNPGPFNRSWGMNCGAAASERSYLAFGDNDIFMSPEDYKTFFDTILDPEVDAVIPGGITVNNPEYKMIKNVKLIEGEDFTYIKELNERHRWTYGGGLNLFKKESLKDCGYWFEEFKGWGAEDNALDELITKCLRYKVINVQLFHIDHSRSSADGNKHPFYQYNVQVLNNIKKQFSLDKDEYIKKRLIYNQICGVGNVNKYRQEGVSGKANELRALCRAFYSNSKPATGKYKKLVLAITTLNRIDYLHTMLLSFLKNSNPSYEWSVIIADDGSDDDTQLYLNRLKQFWPRLFIINNTRKGVAHQFNTIVNKLSSYSFDVCFKCDDDLLFINKGWEKLYLRTIETTGYHHLCYYSTQWRPQVTFAEPVVEKNSLISFCDPLEIQGAFFTITPSMINKVGYMDAKNFAPRGLEHVDYSLRCSKAGFASKNYIYDVLGSNNFIWLNYSEDYNSTVQAEELYEKLNNPEQVKLKHDLMSIKDRVYIPYNESPTIYDDQYMLNLACEVISEMKDKLHEKEKFIVASNHQQHKIQLAHSDDNIGKYLEVKEWYHNEYEVLPLWFKRVGHVIKVVQGKKSLKSLVNKK